MILQHRPIERWPREFTKRRSGSPFSATWTATLRLLERELTHLRARSPIVLQVAVDESQIRLDGQIRADARARHPGVILSFETPKLGNVSIPCDAFERGTQSRGEAWQENVRAIALGLEALRKVERYGIAPRGEQYTGWKALPSGIALGAAMTVDEAARFLVKYGEWGGVEADPEELIGSPNVIAAYYREAAKRLHPDQGGDPEEFRRLTEARDLLVKVS